MIRQKFYFTFIFIIILTTVFAQESVNQYDNSGERHGVWTKNYYQTNQKRYEGVFKNGKEIDSFNYYTLSKGKSVLSAVKVFNEKDSLAAVTFFTSNKKVISKGQMNGKRFIGQWIYYHNNSTAKMIVENYNDDGQLEGQHIVYYKNGNVAEEAAYAKDKQNGEAKWFSKKNILLKVSEYKEGLLDGRTVNYDTDGKVIAEGQYNADQKKGIWIYYENGEETKKIDHTNQKVISKQQ